MILLRAISPILLLSGLVLSTSLHAQNRPVCTTDSDADGDGWGWENFASCVIADSSQTTSNSSGSICIDTDGDGYGWDGTQTCTNITSPSTSTPNVTNNACIDVDGDGWGWDGTMSCRITNSTSQSSNSDCIDTDGDGYGWDGSATCLVAPTTTTPTNSSSSNDCVDPDGDGYGWDGSATCLVTPTSTTQNNSNSNSNSNATNNDECVDPDGDGYGWGPNGSCQIITVIPPTDTGGITDVVLMMGQSNALGEDTEVDLGEDAPDDRVIVWTQFDNWQIGNLCTQKWQKAWFPWRGGICSNHPAFQIAKHIVELDPSRRVAVIPTGTAGKPIRWWDANGIADFQVNATVQTALASLGKSKVDLIAWSQGEADDGNETAWLIKLNDLIARLRNRPWFDASQGQFIAQETKKSSINITVKELASDGDPLTDWVQASDQQTKDGTHWSAPAIRKISERFADKYVN